MPHAKCDVGIEFAQFCILCHCIVAWNAYFPWWRVNICLQFFFLFCGIDVMVFNLQKDEIIYSIKPVDDLSFQDPGHQHTRCGSAQDCSNSIANALELPQSCAEPTIFTYMCISFTVKPLIMCTLVGNKIVGHSDAVGALLIGAASTTYSFST